MLKRKKVQKNRLGLEKRHEMDYINLWNYSDRRRRFAMIEDLELADAIEKLQNAITELILDLKGNGTVSSLADNLKISRNRLADIFEPYKEPDEEEENSERDSSNSQGGTKAKRLYWDLVPLIRIAHALKIRVSELIRAAEDVQDGLPPWFQYRISADTRPRSKEELVHVFLEAVGCRTYVPRNPLNIEARRKSRNHYRINGLSGDRLSDSFEDKDVSILKILADWLFDRTDLADFVKDYQKGKIASKEAYRALKNAVNHINSWLRQNLKKSRGSVRCREAFQLHEHLRENKVHLADAILCEYRDLLQAKQN